VYALILLLSVAMGVQAAAVRRLQVPGIATTYITGTLTSLMVDLVAWVRSAAASSRATDAEGTSVDEASGIEWEQRVGLLAGVFFFYGLGAFAGGILQTRAPILATLAPLFAVMIVVLSAATRRRRRFNAALRTDA
jgi:uncharacterized membrane protein YoaK (UPF0700 family)